MRKFQKINAYENEQLFENKLAKDELKDGTNYLHLSSPLVISKGAYQILTVYK